MSLHPNFYTIVFIPSILNNTDCSPPLSFSLSTEVKQHLKCTDEILNEIAESNVTSPITKSASTPASLQTIVRFQNGSSMSLQHKVSEYTNK